MQGIIVKGVGGLYTVRTQTETVECRARGVFRKNGVTPLTGDRVTVQNGVITEIAPRKNALSRPACANVDKLFIVAATADPDPIPYHIDKLTALALFCGVTPVLVFSKTDRADADALQSLYDAVPLRKYTVSAVTGSAEQLDALRAEICGCTVALSGASGTGKSTLLNLLGGLAQQTGEVSRRLGRGRHTTRCVELFELCGGYVMDTPGFSSLEPEYYGLENRALLAAYFPEFEPYAGRCRFSDCAHTGEPGCAVAEAAESGAIGASRLDSYRKMYADMGEYHAWEKRD